MNGAIPVLPYTPLRNNVRGKVKVWKLIVASLLLRLRKLSGLPTLKYSRTPIIRKLVIPTANNPERFDTSGKFVNNLTKLTCLEITGYRIKCSTVLWPLELHLSGSWLSGLPIIRNGLALRVNLSII